MQLEPYLWRADCKNLQNGIQAYTVLCARTTMRLLLGFLALLLSGALPILGCLPHKPSIAHLPPKAAYYGKETFLDFEPLVGGPIGGPDFVKVHFSGEKVLFRVGKQGHFRRAETEWTKDAIGHPIIRAKLPSIGVNEGTVIEYILVIQFQGRPIGQEHNGTKGLKHEIPLKDGKALKP
jgi:hypothetical protein